MSPVSQPEHFTAAQIATHLGIKRQSVQWHLRDVPAAGVVIVQGNEAAAWTLAQLPPALLQRLAGAAEQQRCRTVETLLTMPRQQWQPAIPLDRLAPNCITAAGKLREALRPWLVRQHDPALTAADLESQALADYKRIFGNAISARYWRELFMRAVRRDGGAENFDRLEIYLPDRLHEAVPAAAMVSEALADDFSALDVLIGSFADPADPTKQQREAVWALTLKKFSSLVADGESEKSAARRLRQYLCLRAPFLAASRDALWMAFSRRLEAVQRAGGDLLAVRDGRAGNGSPVEMPAADIDLLRHSAAFQNGGRLDTAWREVYPRLSESTRVRYDFSQRAPAAVCELVNRELVDALTARHQGKRVLRRLVGSVERDWSGLPSMHSWAVDDMTSNVEVYLQNADGTVSLIQPQIIAVMDCASRKWVGWSISDDKAPTAELVCAAILDGFKRHGVPAELWVENGFVFGKSLNVNGKVDADGRTVVAGLAQYGCEIHHFKKMSPTSKGELEKSFDLLQRLMERHPGYAGRMQMVDAPEGFKREQRLIRGGKAEAAKFRYSLDEFIVVMNKMMEQQNAAPRQGGLNGVSPDEAFDALADKTNPPMKLSTQLHWMLANERYQVSVKTGGVKFTHYGRPIRVRGGELTKHIGSDLWALVDRRDDSMVTFATLDYSETFTIEACEKPSVRESSLEPDSGVMAAELSKIGEHTAAVDNLYKNLRGRHGNPRQDLLAEIRAADLAPGRHTIIDPRISESAAQMHEQRQAIRDQKKSEQKQQRQARRFVERTGVELPPRARENITPENARLVSDFLAEESAAPAVATPAPAAKSLTEKNGKLVYHLKPAKKGKLL